MQSPNFAFILFLAAGAPYAGASAQRMGSASLRKSPVNKNASGAIANKAVSILGVYTGFVL
jgi:hypothetical protein